MHFSQRGKLIGISTQTNSLFGLGVGASVREVHLNQCILYTSTNALFGTEIRAIVQHVHHSQCIFCGGEDRLRFVYLSQFAFLRGGGGEGGGSCPPQPMHILGLG